MRILYLDTCSGIAGDMFLGLTIDLGVDEAEIRNELAKLNLPGYRLETRQEKRCGIAGTYINIDIDEDQPARNWQQIDNMLADSKLDPADQDLSRRIFRRLGEAEAKIHATELEQVHFHEVGAVDSIIDIVGAAISLNRLQVDQVLCSPLPIGTGAIKTEHGSYPLPAPATMELLKGCPVRPDDSGLELVTPTGAVIAAEIATFAPLPAMTIEKSGYGLGTRDIEGRPNVLRGIIGETVTNNGSTDTVSVIETHLDDCNPEWLGALIETLFEQGALDVVYAPLQMKKNRPGTRITVICRPETAGTMERLILRHSSAIGVRRYQAERRKLRREENVVETAVGPAEVKCIYDGDTLIRVTPEFESCRQLAKATDRPLPEVYRLAEQAAAALFPPESD
ncbi:MAG: TIGR00299 family protein [Desulfuromonas sp.]|nr:MAG: TIGR00299 family protein [Desulfuromonas sp.]